MSNKGMSDISDFSASDDEFSVIPTKKKVVKNVVEEEDDFEDSEDEDIRVVSKKAGEEAEDEEDNEEEENEKEDEEDETVDAKKDKLDRLKKLKAVKKSKHKTGVIYLSKIPPYMKPAKMRQILSTFGEIDRLYLRKEDETKHKQRTKSGGNKKTMYEEGWCEFIRKKDAKLAASTLNGNKLGGRKGSFYYDDIMNVKYLSGFKWTHLTDAIAREKDIRDAKLQLEITQANKINKEFIQNVERAKMIENMQKKREQTDEIEVRRTFKQRKVTTQRADGPEQFKEKSSKQLDTVLTNLF